MEKQNIKHILEKVENGNATPQEELQARLWLFQLNEKKNLDLSDESLEAVSEQMWSAIQQQKTSSGYIIRKTALWPKIGIAASVTLIFLLAGILYYQVMQPKVSVRNQTYVNDVAPGKQGATLTLAGGKKIELGELPNGQIAYQSGITISKTADGQLIYTAQQAGKESDLSNMLTTANGQTYQVKLPDGSKVWLNASSVLKYPASFINKRERRVELSGEGYFEISKDKLHPFIVKTDKQLVRVLGTHFNINSYPDEANVKTTLIEGSVVLTAGTNNKTLMPNQQALLTGSELEIKDVDIEEVIAWKNNEFLFKNDDFRANMRKIARWYNLQIVYQKDAPYDFKLGGFLSRSRSLSTVLKLMENTDKVHFRVEGRKLYVGK